jgi:hypothetical protein
MKVADKDKLYEEVKTLEKSIRKKNPDQHGRVMIANAKCDMDMCIGRMNDVNEIQWLLEYREKLKGIDG